MEEKHARVLMYFEYETRKIANTKTSVYEQKSTILIPYSRYYYFVNKIPKIYMTFRGSICITACE